MCKKLWVAALAVGVGLLLIGTPIAGWLASNAKVAWNKSNQAIEENTPIEWEIQRLEAQLPDLQTEIKQHRVAVAREEVELDTFKAQIKTEEAGLVKEKEKLKGLLRAVEDSDGKYVSFGGRDMSFTTAKERLASATESCKTAEKSLETKRRTLESRERGLDAARDRLEAMKSRHNQLKNDLDQLKAEYAELQAQKAAQKLPTDDSRTAKLAQDVQKLKNRMKVESKLAAEDASSFAAEDKDPKDVVKDARDYLEKDSSTVNK
jgi:peptidoglycan hydrolase CwlO-like protein